jgi:hypothetical protein
VDEGSDHAHELVPLKGKARRDEQDEAKRLKQLEEENRRLKKSVAH